MEKFLFEKLLDEIEDGDRVLDVGCGDGTVMKEIARIKDVKIRGTDPFPGDWNCYNFTAEEIDEIKEKFNVVYLVKSFHHIGNVESFLKSVKNVMYPMARMVIIDWKYGVDTGVDERYYKKETVEKLLEEHNFIIKKSDEFEETFFIVAQLPGDG